MRRRVANCRPAAAGGSGRALASLAKMPLKPLDRFLGQERPPDDEGGGEWQEYIVLIYLGKNQYLVADMNNEIASEKLSDFYALRFLPRPPRTLAQTIPLGFLRADIEIEEDYEPYTPAEIVALQ